MVIKSFPPIETANPEGLLAIGGDLEVGSLKLAYQNGIFPWPSQGYPLLWFTPPMRAVLEFKKLRIPKRFQRELKKKNFHYRVDQNFSRVIHACAKGLTRDSTGTWILPEMVEAYLRFHEAGYAHSFECYNEADQLIGGMYGISLGNMFAGESMFYWESGASKAVLLYAIDYLKSHGGLWMDVQMISPLLASFGAREISREKYLLWLGEALKAKPIFP